MIGKAARLPGVQPATMRALGFCLLVALAASGGGDSDHSERRLDLLIDGFCNGSPLERKAAREALRRYGTRAWLRLRDLLDHDDPDIRQRARLVWNAIVTDRGRNWKVPTLQTSYDPATGLPAMVREKSSGLLMFLVRPGTVAVGGRVIELTEPLYVGVQEMTRAQYGAGRPDLIYIYPEKSADLPMTNLTTEAIGKLCRATGLRLPTRAEWEYAYYSGKTPDEKADESPRTARVPVGSTRPNRHGIYGMGGNVAEWCTGRRGGPPAFLMGGSYLDSRPAVRAPPTRRGPQIGFRLVRRP